MMWENLSLPIKARRIINNRRITDSDKYWGINNLFKSHSYSAKTRTNLKIVKKFYASNMIKNGEINKDSKYYAHVLEAANWGQSNYDSSNFSIVKKSNNKTSAAKTNVNNKSKTSWTIYVTPEIANKVNELMKKHRWNRTQALDYIFETFFK